MYNILIVDDDEPYAESLKDILARFGFAATVCIRSEDATKAAKELLPDLDLILLDIVMPKVDGTAVASLIRGDQELKNVAIVFLTGSGKGIVTHADLPDGIGKIGGDDFVLKGTKKEKVAHHLEKVIQETRAKNANRNN